MKISRFLLCFVAFGLALSPAFAQSAKQDDRAVILVIAGTSMTSQDLDDFLRETPVGTAETLQRHQQMRQMVRNSSLIFITIPEPGKPASRGDKRMFQFDPTRRDKGMQFELKTWMKTAGYMEFTLEEGPTADWPELGRFAEVRLYSVRRMPR